MAKANLTAAQRRAAEIVDRIEGAATCINGARGSLDLAASYGARGNASAADRIKWARTCVYDAFTLLRPCLPAGRSPEIKEAMRCMDSALTDLR